MINVFTKENFHAICDELALEDKSLEQVITQYGYPPFWTRPNTFETLVLTILEQQISLVAAFAAYRKLKERLTDITPANVLLLDDEALRSCYFSRQKIVYVRELAKAIVDEKINLQQFQRQPDDVVRTALKKLKGIGDWTVDIYLIHALQRSNILPLGDLALINALRMLKEKPLTKEAIQKLSKKWEPYRSVGTMLCWHYYIKKKNIKLLH